MVGAWFGGAGDRHVRIADGLDLLHAAIRSGLVELGEELVEKPHDSVGIGPLRPWREVDDVGEEDRGIGVGSAMRSSPCFRRVAIDRGMALVSSSSTRASAVRRRVSIYRSRTKTTLSGMTPFST